MGVLIRHWGWVVTSTSFCIFFTAYGLLFTYGQLYIEFQEEFNSSNTETGWIGSLAISLTATATFLTNRLLQRFSNRSVATLGIVLLAAACLSTSLMRTFYPIFFTYGILVGVGICFILISAMNLIIKYFPGTDAHRATTFAITGSTSGMLTMSPLVNLMISHWGWRNMLRVMGGIILFVGLPCVFTHVQPPQKNIDSDNDKRTTDSNSNGGTHKRLVEEDESKQSISQSETKYERNGTEKKEFEVGTLGDKQSDNHSTIRHRRTLKEQLEILLFPELWIFAVPTTITSAGQCFFYVSYVSFLTTSGFEKSDAAFVMTTIAIAEVVGKLLLSALGDNQRRY